MGAKRAEAALQTYLGVIGISAPNDSIHMAELIADIGHFAEQRAANGQKVIETGLLNFLYESLQGERELPAKGSNA